MIVVSPSIHRRNAFCEAINRNALDHDVFLDERLFGTTSLVRNGFAHPHRAGVDCPLLNVELFAYYRDVIVSVFMNLHSKEGRRFSEDNNSG